jgi:hypothetical protein
MTIISLDTGATHVRYGELADLIATAMHPHVERLDNEASFGEYVEAILRCDTARKAFAIELSKAVQSGALPVKDPVTFGPRSYPDGDGLQNALVLVDDLRVFLNGRPISVVVADGMKALAASQANGPQTANAENVNVVAKPVTTPTITHSTRSSRRDVLVPVIESAQSKCTNPKDTSAVWAQLVVLAQNETPPLLAATQGGLKYTKEGVDAYFKRDALAKRLNRKKTA